MVSGTVVLGALVEDVVAGLDRDPGESGGRLPGRPNIDGPRLHKPAIVPP